VCDEMRVRVGARGRARVGACLRASGSCSARFTAWCSAVYLRTLKYRRVAPSAEPTRAKLDHDRVLFWYVFTEKGDVLTVQGGVFKQ
jgi:hypothetical protein